MRAALPTANRDTHVLISERSLLSLTAIFGHVTLTECMQTMWTYNAVLYIAIHYWAIISNNDFIKISLHSKPVSRAGLVTAGESHSGSRLAR